MKKMLTSRSPTYCITLGLRLPTHIVTIIPFDSAILRVCYLGGTTDVIAAGVREDRIAIMDLDRIRLTHAVKSMTNVKVVGHQFGLSIFVVTLYVVVHIMRGIVGVKKAMVRIFVGSTTVNKLQKI